jgi:hypothetical protein
MARVKRRALITSGPNDGLPAVWPFVSLFLFSTYINHK